MVRTPREQAIWLYGASEQNVGVDGLDGYPLDCYDYQSTCGAKNVKMSRDKTCFATRCGQSTVIQQPTECSSIACNAEKEVEMPKTQWGFWQESSNRSHLIKDIFSYHSMISYEIRLILSMNILRIFVKQRKLLVHSMISNFCCFEV